jgi:hypothetical protein
MAESLTEYPQASIMLWEQAPNLKFVFLKDSSISTTMKDGGFSRDGSIKLKNFQIKTTSVYSFPNKKLLRDGRGLKTGK